MPCYSDQKSGGLEQMQAMMRGDAAEFAHFYDGYAPTVFAFLCKMFRDRTEAEDMLQETFLQAWRQAARYDPDRGSPIAWLIKIARSRGIDRLRQLRLKTLRDGGPIEEWHEQVQTQPSVEAMAMEQNTQGVVYMEIDKLPIEQREAMTMAFFGGLTHHEIAKRLATPLGTIKTRIRLGIKKLQEAIQKRGVCA
jgi:RNA polymerase sigma-70 factor (ECF subfamily)